jgi:lipoprotein-anchoring transpeptidase ErfK/SrfK
MRTTTMRRLAVALLAATVVGACGADGDTRPAATPTASDRDAVPDGRGDTEVPGPGGGDGAGAPDDGPADTDAAPPVARVARLTDHLDVLVAPSPDAEVVRSLSPSTGFGSTTVVSVRDEADGWLEVELAGRPTGLTGYVPVDAVQLVEVSLEVHVDLTTRQLTVLEEGEVVLTTAVAIGDAEHPTPVGRFFVTDKLDTQDPDGPYGPFALGLSVRSEVLTEFAGGDGQIGIHGTNDPTSIGRDVSHGCVRVPNDVVRQLVELLPLGTPVVVT